MGDVQALPGKMKIQLFVRNRSQGLALGANGFVVEILIGTGKLAAAQSSKSLAGTVTSSASNASEASR